MKNEKSIRVAILNGDDTKVKVNFRGGIFSPEEFTSMFMAILETYTEGLLATNTREDVFKHFNRVFGIFLEKIVPTEQHYALDPSHKEFKDMVDNTLGKEEDTSVKKATENNKFAAYLLCKDVLINEIGLTEESADKLLGDRLGLNDELLNPEFKNEKK